MKSAEEILQELGDTSQLANVALHWDDAMAEYPAGGPHFLAADFIRRCCAATGMDAGVEAELLAVAAVVRADESLAQLAWHCHWRVFRAPAPCPPQQWPEPACLGERRGLLYLLAAIAYVPMVYDHHQRLGVPEATTRETLQQVAHFCNYNYRRGYGGRPGIYLNQMSWMRHYTREPYFRLGRLEFWLEPMKRDMTVYRHRQTGQVVAFPPAGTRFSADGYRYAREEDYAGEDSWLSELSLANGCVCGTPISPHGYARREKVALSLADWELVLSKGDDSLSMHIPSGGNMSLDACRDSLLRARNFFRKYFPDRPVRAVNCASWIFNNQLQEILPATANLVQFQRELYLCPVPSSAWDGLWFVFLKNGPFDLKDAPRDTDLQRRILDFLATGRRWRAGGMFFLLDDLDRFGSQPYCADAEAFPT
ncbi:MAG: DUF5596 domain-containing protein [Lentisphaerae bacterium]|nr:DUF5596 domain-containing protein [Lentisphaerota bacterium]